MAEDYELTDPIQPPPPPATTTYRVSSLTLDRDIMLGSAPPVPPELPAPPEAGQVLIKLKDNLGRDIYCQYRGQEAQELMKWMNTANFSTTSMHKRILQKLENDGQIPPGDVTGTPDVPAMDEP